MNVFWCVEFHLVRAVPVCRLSTALSTPTKSSEINRKYNWISGLSGDLHDLRVWIGSSYLQGQRDIYEIVIIRLHEPPRHGSSPESAVRHEPIHHGHGTERQIVVGVSVVPLDEVIIASELLINLILISV